MIIDTSNWDTWSGWKIAPDGLPWIAKGSLLRHGEDVCLEEDVRIASYCQINDGVRLAKHVRLCSHVHIRKGVHIEESSIISGGVKIGERSRIMQNVSIGHDCIIGDRVCIAADVSIGDDVRIGSGCYIENKVVVDIDSNIGDCAFIGPHAHHVIDLGCVDGYRKCLAVVDGVAHIGAGCRWFTVDEGIRHWSDKPYRADTRALMNYAAAIAISRGWRLA